MKSPAERLMSAADILDQQAATVPAEVQTHLASLLLLRGTRLAQFRPDAQVALCGREPSREMLAIADLVLAGVPS